MVFSCNIEKDCFEYEYPSAQIAVSKVYQCYFDWMKPRNFPHFHNCYEISFVKAGEGTFRSGVQVISLKKNTVFIGYPQVTHEIVFEGQEPLELYFFTIKIHSKINTKTADEKSVIIQEFLKNGLVFVENCDRMILWMDMISKYSAIKENYGLKLIFEAMVLDILFALTPSSKEIVKVEPLEIQIRQFVEENIRRNVSIHELCQYANMSERSLFYYFNNKFHSTPQQYINSRKMTMAVSYLQMGFPIKNIAQLLGDMDPSSFSRMFKKHYGISPVRYIKENLR